MTCKHGNMEDDLRGLEIVKTRNKMDVDRVQVVTLTGTRNKCKRYSVNYNLPECNEILAAEVIKCLRCIRNPRETF